MHEEETGKGGNPDEQDEQLSRHARAELERARKMTISPEARRSLSKYRFYRKISVDPALLNPQTGTVEKPAYMEIPKEGYSFDPRIKEPYLEQQAALCSNALLRITDFDVDQNWVAPMPSNRLFVSSIPSGSNPSSVTFFFEDFGPVVSVELVRDPNTGRFCEDGAVVMEDWRHAQSAVRKLLKSKPGSFKAVYDPEGKSFRLSQGTLFKAAQAAADSRKTASSSKESTPATTQKGTPVIPPLELPKVQSVVVQRENSYGKHSSQKQQVASAAVFVNFRFLPKYVDPSAISEIFRNYALKKIECGEKGWSIELEGPEDVKRCLVCLNGRVVNGRRIQVEDASISHRAGESNAPKDIARAVIDELARNVLALFRHRTLGEIVNTIVEQHLEYIRKKRLELAAEIHAGNLNFEQQVFFRPKALHQTSMRSESPSEKSYFHRKLSGKLLGDDSQESVSTKSEDEAHADHSSVDVGDFSFPDYSPELPPPHASGCARTEGYYRIERRYITRNPADVFSPQDSSLTKVTSFKKAPPNLMRSKRASARSIAASTLPGEMLKFSALKLRKKRLKVERSSIHSFGLFSLENIEAFDFVTEYVGEIIRLSVAEKREKEYERRGVGSSYFFRLDEEWVIDSTRMGNVARFINHCCNPNCIAKVVNVDGSKRIVFYARRQIKEGEEITYDYKFPKEVEKIPCHCGVAECRGTLN